MMSPGRILKTEARLQHHWNYPSEGAIIRHARPHQDHLRPDARLRRAASWSIARIRLRSAVTHHPMISGCPTSSRPLA